MALKSYKPTTPSQRQLVLVDRSALYSGKPVKSLFCSPDAAAALGDQPTEVLIATAGGAPIACEATARTIPYRDSIRTVVSIRDLRERKRAEARIIHLAHHDPLTDLPNRTAFNERLEMTLENADRTGTAFAVLQLVTSRLFHQPLSPWQIGGIVCVGVGICLLQLGARS